MFLVDASFVVFNNSPPRVVVQELTLELTCAESCFQADSPQECFSYLVGPIEDRAGARKVPLLKEAIELLCHKALDASTIAIFARMSVLNLFSIVSGKCQQCLQIQYWKLRGKIRSSPAKRKLTVLTLRVALHCIVFHLQTWLVYLSPMTSPIRKALDGWKVAWDARSDLHQSENVFDTSQAEAWRRDGFMRHAEEFRSLALVSLERLDLSMLKGQEFSSSDDVLHSPHGGLGGYDETSMSQVADLMLAFQSLSTA